MAETLHRLSTRNSVARPAFKISCGPEWRATGRCVHLCRMATRGIRALVWQSYRYRQRKCRVAAKPTASTLLDPSKSCPYAMRHPLRCFSRLADDFTVAKLLHSTSVPLTAGKYVVNSKRRCHASCPFLSSSRLTVLLLRVLAHTPAARKDAMGILWCTTPRALQCCSLSAVG